MRQPKMDPYIFWPAVILIGSVLIMLGINPEAGRQTIASMLTFITRNFDTLFEWVAFGGLIWLAWLAFGKYGKIKLGGPDDKPEFSTFSWIAMMITSASGMGLMYWACVEPAWYLAGPPFGIEPQSAAAGEWALAYGIYHWGFAAWALQALPAVAIAYAYHVRKVPFLKARIACAGVLGKYADGIGGRIIDMVVLVGLVGGLGTSLGVVIPLMSALFNEMFGIQPSLWLDGLVIAIWTVMFGTTAYLGLDKGIQKLSDINVWAAIGLLVFIFVIGPTTFLLSYFGQSVGVLLQNFIKMSTYTDPILKSGWPQDWTVFYWAWWAVFAVYMGLFVARVSKGRTIKEMILGAVFCPAIGAALFYLTFGGYMVHLQFNEGMNVVQILNEQGGGFLIVALLKTLPLAKIVIPFFMIVGFIYQATTFQGAAYTLASMATDELLPHEQPAPWQRLFWAIVIGCVGFVMMVIGGLKVVQLASVVLGVPVLIIILMSIYSAMKWIKEDYNAIHGDEVVILTKEQKKDSDEVKLVS